MITSVNNWWEKIADTQVKSLDGFDWYCLVSPFLQDCIQNRKTAYHISVNGYVEDLKVLDELNRFLAKHYLLASGSDANEPDAIADLIVAPEFFLAYSLAEEGYLMVTGYASNKEAYNSINEILKKVALKKVKNDSVYVMTRGEMGLRLSALGRATSEFQEVNYSKDVVEKFYSVVEEFQKPSPSGRLVIMDGEPGVGKSYMIRAFLDKIQNGVWIIIPSEMIASLSGPDLISVLLQQRQNKLPIYIIAEDADEALASRTVGNMSSVSTLLNISEGLLSQLIDIRVLCTTNSKAEDFDSAAIRDGRLLQRIDIGELSREEAIKVYININGKEPPDELFTKDSYKLASAYALSKRGKVHAKKTERKAGFL